MFPKEYDVIVVGAGHAGSEAAAAAANLGSKTLLITMNLQNIAQMSCNPAMGGIAKGQIVREIDALGGYSGIVSDETAIQFKMLNKSKGPAMWSPRVQSDRMRFSETWRDMLEKTPNLDFYQEMVSGLITKNNKVVGVKTSLGIEIRSKTVVLTNGTFLNGVIHIGDKQFGGGRAGERASTGITSDLIQLGFESGRMKTGTPPRVDGRSLDFTKMIEQPGDEQPEKFSYLDTTSALKLQRSCYMSYTSQTVHDILKEGFDKSPMFNGAIKSSGPRYCPSIEEKINRFADKDRHQLFVEPEGWKTIEYYINGFSTSLSEEIQFKALKQVSGFENVKFFRPGYAIEYDYFPPTQLRHTLETKLVGGLYFAGQINGTTGYEEAAAQGLVAGLNAARAALGKDSIIFDRAQAYIGVMIDDLVTRGVSEPYRMFTSRAEYRLSLRADNADQRLTNLGFECGLVSEKRQYIFEKKMDAIDKAKTLLNSYLITPTQAKKAGISIKQDGIRRSAMELLSFKDVSFDKLGSMWPDLSKINQEVRDQLEKDAIYINYIDRQSAAVNAMRKDEKLIIPENFNYSDISGLSNELKQKLMHSRPSSLAQAGRIEGMTPAGLALILTSIRKFDVKRTA